MNFVGEEHDNVTQKARAYDWVRGTFNGASKEFLSHHQELNSDKFTPKFTSIPNTGISHQQLLRNRGYGANIPDGNSHGGSSKHSDSMSDEVPTHNRLQSNGRAMSNGVEDTELDSGHIPYDVLINDLTQAKRQLIDLQNLVSTDASFLVCMELVCRLSYAQIFYAIDIWKMLNNINMCHLEDIAYLIIKYEVLNIKRMCYLNSHSTAIINN